MIPVLILLFIGSLQEPTDEYTLYSRNLLQDSKGQSFQGIFESKLVWKKKQDEATFELIHQKMQIWLKPRKKETEEKALEQGTPIDGTPFTPKSSEKEVHLFNLKKDVETSVEDKSKAELGTMDILNLVFYQGKACPFNTENIAILDLKYGKQYNFKISEHDVVLYIYWYDQMKRREIKETPAFLIVVKDEKDHVMGCRLNYQVIKTTTRAISEYDLLSKEADIDLDEILKELNTKLTEKGDLNLRVLHWENTFEPQEAPAKK